MEEAKPEEPRTRAGAAVHGRAQKVESPRVRGRGDHGLNGLHSSQEVSL